MNLRYCLDVIGFFPCLKVVIFWRNLVLRQHRHSLPSAAISMRRHTLPATESRLCPAIHGSEETFPLIYTCDAEGARLLFLFPGSVAPGKSPGHARHTGEAVVWATWNEDRTGRPPLFRMLGEQRQGALRRLGGADWVPGRCWSRTSVGLTASPSVDR